MQQDNTSNEKSSQEGAAQPIGPAAAFGPAQPHVSEKPAPRVLDRPKIIQLVVCAGLALFWVIFNWGFWSHGPEVWGLNAFVFYLGWLLLMVWTIHIRRGLQKADWAWIVPMLLIAISFWLYTNPFLKIISIMLWPILLAVFVTYAFTAERAKRAWNLDWVGHLITRFLTPLTKIGRSIMYYLDLLSGRRRGKRLTLAKKISIGALILLAALLVIVPILSSADPAFANILGDFWKWIEHILGEDLVLRILCLISLGILLFAGVLGWARRTPAKEAGERKQIDDVIGGIVLVGILIVYAIFIVVQLERLWVGELPFDFAETELLVKSGFWQLLFLSFVNILIYFIYYRRTKPWGQGLLIAFAGASVLLLASAAYRMGLYVTNYGFSYEKFYASYAVLFCLVVFGWLIVQLLNKKHADVLKFLVFLFLWMFGLIAIVPAERIILQTNVALQQREDSRIHLYELTMLSTDVLDLVEKYNSQGLLDEEVCETETREGDCTIVEKEVPMDPEMQKVLDEAGIEVPSQAVEVCAPDYETAACQLRQESFGWDNWISKKQEQLAQKTWYEKTLSEW